jgi:hypothetical protein
MRTMLFLVLLGSQAFAGSRAQVISYGLDPELVPVTCYDMVTGTRMGARLSVASCAANVALDKMQLDDPATVAAKIEHAVQFSMDLLDSVSVAGTPTERVEALHARADLYKGMIARLRRAAPLMSWHNTTLDKHAEIERVITPWQHAAAADGAAIAMTVKAHPDVQMDRVARYSAR